MIKRMNESTDITVVRQFVKSAYDLQALRIQSGNRVCAQFRAKLGVSPGEKIEEDEDASDVIEAIRDSYRRVTDGIIDKRGTIDESRFKGDAIITTTTELKLVKLYVELEQREASTFRALESILENVPIYSQFLAHVRGCGPALSGVLVCTLDPHKAKYPSSFWKYSGLDVAPVFERDDAGEVIQGKDPVWLGRSRRRDHLVEVEYLDRDKKPAKRMGITFNPWLKTKLYLLGTVFIRLRSPYRAHYDNYLHRISSIPKWAESTKMHRHNAAIRFMMKMFLADLWRAWRELEGLPVEPPYSAVKLGKTNHEPLIRLQPAAGVQPHTSLVPV